MEEPLRGSILSMLDMKERWIEGGRFPYTPSVNQVYSINECVSAILDEGLDRVINRHTEAAELCRYEIRKLGLELWPVSDDICSTCVTAIKMPDTITDKKLITHLREKYRLMISGSHGELAGKLFRIGHMGWQAHEAYVEAAVYYLERTLIDLGV